MQKTLKLLFLPLILLAMCLSFFTEASAQYSTKATCKCKEIFYMHRAQATAYGKCSYSIGNGMCYLNFITELTDNSTETMRRIFEIDSREFQRIISDYNSGIIFNEYRIENRRLALLLTAHFIVPIVESDDAYGNDINYGHTFENLYTALFEYQERIANAFYGNHNEPFSNYGELSHGTSQINVSLGCFKVTVISDRIGGAVLLKTNWANSELPHDNCI